MSNEIHNQLLGMLRRIYVRWRTLTLCRGIARTIVVGLVLLSVGLAADAAMGMSYAGRILLAVILYGFLILDAWKSWARYVLKPYSPRHVAWILEKKLPELDERLITAVELAEAHREHLSLDLIAHTIEQTSIDLRELAPETTFRVRWHHFTWPAISVAILAALLFIAPLHLPARVGRILAPSPRDPQIGRVFVRLRLPHERQFTEGDIITAIVELSPAETRLAVELVLQAEDIELQRMTPGDRKGGDRKSTRLNSSHYS